MNKLPIWRLTGTLPASRDSESATVLEQTYKLYQKMQELITDYNEFATKVNKEIEDHESKYESDMEEFTMSIRQEYQDFMDSVDLKLTDIGYNDYETLQATINEVRKSVEDLSSDVKEYEISVEQSTAKPDRFTIKQGGVVIKEVVINSIARAEYSSTSGSAKRDENNNVIHETYATKDELANTNYVGNERLLDGSVTPEKTTFLIRENKNLFNGVLNSKNIYLQGNDSGGLRFAGSQLKGKGFAVSIKPNTSYTIIKDKVSETLESNSYYNFKFGTTSHSLDVVNSNIENWTGFDLDGTIAVNQSSNTDYAKKVFNFTSGANDNTLIVMVGLENEPYIEVLEGTFSDFQYNTYGEIYNPKGLNIYNKNEVDKKIAKAVGYINNISCVNGVCTINLGKASYIFQRNTKSNINLDTYMFTSGTINGNVVFSGTDIEAPIKEKNTEDFIGGVHGDEIYSDLHVLVDGVEKDISTNFELEFNKVTIFVKSTLYHCNTSNECFTRHKKLEFEKDTLTISNRLICLDSFIVERYTGTGVYSIYKSLLNGYSTNVDNEYYEIVGSTTESEIKSSTSKDLTEAYFYGNDYSLSIKALTNSHSEYYKGGISDFYNETKPRLKIYLDSINETSNGVTINVGEELQASFEIKIN